jgi:signal transduction histidine kinase
MQAGSTESSPAALKSEGAALFEREGPRGAHPEETHRKPGAGAAPLRLGDHPLGGDIDVLEVISDLLLGIGEGSPPDAFFSSLCAAICKLTALRRAVLFRYDAAQRRVRAVGAHGLEVEPYLDLHVTIDSVPVARRALIEDEVQEVVGGEDFKIPVALRERLQGLALVCTPMQAAGRCVGVVIGDRDPAVPRMSEEERLLLRTIGKAIAMAYVARSVTRYHERSKQLQQRIDLAREIHEAVIQRLFGVSLVLSSAEPLDLEARKRCAAEVQGALADLRAALQRPLRYTSPATALTFAQELARQQALHAEPAIELVSGSADEVPEQLEALAQSILVEALRNVRKHSRAPSVQIALANRDRTFTLEIRNRIDPAAQNGAQSNGGSPHALPQSENAQARGSLQREGIGLHVASLEALTHGGVLEYGQALPGIWQVRLVVPTDH